MKSGFQDEDMTVEHDYVKHIALSMACMTACELVRSTPHCCLFILVILAQLSVSTSTMTLAALCVIRQKHRMAVFVIHIR